MLVAAVLVMFGSLANLRCVPLARELGSSDRRHLQAQLF